MFSSILDLPTPKPMPSEEFYLHERQTRLAYSKACQDNFEKYIKSSKRDSNPDYLPIKLDIENLSRCNFRCVMCQVSEWAKGQRARDLTFHEFQEIIDENVGLVEIKIQGMGEPTLAKDDFYRMIKYARDRHIWVRTVTNGSLLHLNDNSRKLLESGINEIQISIDGADKDTFEKIRVGGKFDRVVDNVTKLNELAAAMGQNVTKMWTVVQDQNVDQLRDLVSLASQMKFKSMVFSLDISDWGNSDWTTKIKEKTVTHIFDINYANDLYKFGLDLGINVAFWNINSKYEITNKEKLCPWPFERSYIASDNRVVPCCMVADPDTFEIKGPGTFVEIWNSKQYQRFRDSHLTGDVNKLPSICQNCYKN
jgi:MoaA/NifB/PqqE/SkfB family radical SAM enzyme